MAEWPTMTLAQAGVILIDCVHATPEAKEVGFPYVAIPQMKDGRLDFDGSRKISRADFIEWTRKARPQRHDIVLSRRTNPGVIAPVMDDTEFALGQNLVLLRANGNAVAPPFLRWLASSPYWWDQIAKFNNVGAIFDSLRCADVPNFELPIPPMGVQERIAELLTALDDKIELNRRMNATLEAQARALFRDWFVDFGPTRAKQAGVPAYLATDLWDIFPPTIDIKGNPEGWEERPLTDFFEIIGGGTPKTSVAEFWDGDVPWYSVADTPPSGSVFVIETEKTITEAGVAGSSVRMVPAGTTIISARGTVGNLAVTGRDMTFNQSCYGLRGKGGIGDAFVFLASQHMVTRLQAMSHGSIFSTITRDTFAGVELPQAGRDVLKAFEKFVQPMFAKIRANVEQSRTLAQTRELLLPKLMSGEISVRLAEAEISMAF